MNVVRIIYLDKLVLRSKEHTKKKEISLAWRLLEEAHILSQPYPGQHTYVHWEMLMLACKERSLKEIMGQIIRLIVAAPGSLLGKYPVGNTGRTNISMFRPMEIPRRIEEKMRHLDKEEAARIKAGGELEKRKPPVLIKRKGTK